LQVEWRISPRHSAEHLETFEEEQNPFGNNKRLVEENWADGDWDDIALVEERQDGGDWDDGTLVGEKRQNENKSWVEEDSSLGGVDTLLEDIGIVGHMHLVQEAKKDLVHRNNTED